MIKRVLKSPAFRFALQVYLSLRVALSGVAALVRALYPGDLGPHEVLRPYLGVTPVEGGARGLLLGVWQRWDTLWYMLIARDGYSMQDTRIFAPPLYPWLMRALGSVFGGGEAALLFAGLIVSNLACIALLTYLYLLVEHEWDVVRARRSVVYLAIFPTSFYLFAAYAESLFLLCAVAAFYHARRGEWLPAGIWGLFCPLARLPGVVIVAPLGWEYARQWWIARGSAHPLPWWRGWPLVLVVLGGLAYPLYAYWVIGSGSLWAPFAVHTQRFMGRFAWPWESLWTAVRVLASGQFRFVEPFDLLLALLFIALTIAAFRKLPLIYPLYMAAMLAGTLTKVSDIQPLLAVSRYVLVLFPGFVVLARWGWQRVWVHRLVIYGFSALLIFFTGQFAIWGWVG
jgi:hypothetical protein